MALAIVWCGRALKLSAIQPAASHMRKHVTAIALVVATMRPIMAVFFAPVR